jgi:YidC/Oxa1 family membrane protein insertase
MLNLLLSLYAVLGRNFGLSIIVFTVLVRLVTLPIQMQQTRSARKSQELQPQLQELQRKYAKDRDKLAEEQMKLYREAGVNPLGCLLPTLIQFPIWIGLYQSIIHALPDNPIQLLNLGRFVYRQFPLLSNLASVSNLSSLIPLNNQFLWLNLGRPDPWYVLPLLTVATMWVQQKMMATPSTDPQAQAMAQSMELMMPMMFGFITLQVASGLGLYFVATNLFGIVLQYFVGGWGGLAGVFPMLGGRRDQTKGKKNARKR